MRAIKHAWIILVLLAGCSTIGAPAAQSFDQQLAYAYGSVSAAQQSTADALNQGQIKVSDAQAVQSLAGQVRSALDAAKGFETSGDMTSAQGKLAAATTILVQLQTYLTSHGVK